MLSILVLTPHILQRLMKKIGISIFDLEALGYFGGVVNKIIGSRGQEVTKHKDFVQLCVDQLIDEPDLSDPATQIDKKGQVWSTKG